MIDTIAILLKQNEFKIIEHSKFNPSTEGLYSSYTRGVRRYIQNPSKKDYLQGIYRPRLTIYKRPFEGVSRITMRVEFSAPKLLLGNNFEELEDEDFRKLCTSLVMLLGEMGVVVSRKVLQNASLSAIHYSKNIFLDSTPCSTAISEIKKAKPLARMDTNQTDYRNGGHSYKFHTNTFELAFYDKVADLKQAKTSKKRAEEKQNALQLDLFEPLEQQRMNVLRIEARLTGKQKIKQTLEKIGLPESEEITFEKLFKKSIAQKILLQVMEELEKGLFIKEMAVDFDNPLQTFKELLFANKGKHKKRMTELFSLITFIKQSGFEETRKAYGNTYQGKKGNQRWSRDMKAIRELKKVKTLPVPIFREIRRYLEAFESITLNTHPDFDFLLKRKESRFQYKKPKKYHFKNRNEKSSNSCTGFEQTPRRGRSFS